MPQQKKALDDKETFFCFFLYKYMLCVRRKEAGTMPSVTRGAASPWFTRRSQKPADGESEPNYWLGYASGPRTDQQHCQNLREWDSLCCLFRTGLSDVEDDPLMFHHLSRALR